MNKLTIEMIILKDRKDINALSKIVTRISNLESQFRKIKYSEINSPRDIYKKSTELFTKYALSN